MDSNSNHDDYKKFIVLNLSKEVSKENQMFLLLLAEMCFENKQKKQYQVEFIDGKYRAIPCEFIS
jgi:hypothetical protein